MTGIQLYTAEVGDLIINVCLFLTSPLGSYQGCNVTLPVSLSLLTYPSDHWAPLTGGSASPSGSLGRRSGVFFMELIHHSVPWPAAWPVLISAESFFCRWSDKTDLEFQNWAKVSGRTRKNGLCVTMSSSTGEDLQRHSRL